MKLTLVRRPVAFAGKMPALPDFERWIMEIQNLEDVAMVIRPAKDNVAVVTADFVDAGTQLRYKDEVDHRFRAGFARVELCHPPDCYG